MISRIKSINPVLYIIGLVLLFGLSHLSVPYFWDEIGVYSRAALYMFDHQIGLMPDSLPSVISRGHPVLFAAIFGTAFKILGPHVWVARLVAIMFSSALIYLLWRFSSRYYGNKVAIVACLLLAVQPLFIAQSILILPEMVLAVFCVLSIYSYFNNDYFRLALFSSLAIMVKETAIFLPCCIGLIELIKVCYAKELSKRAIFNLCCISSPLLIWGVFLLLQKMQNGWFLYPLHSGYISFSLSDIYSRICYYLGFLFFRQGRFIWAMLVVMSIGLFTWKEKQVLFCRSAIFAFLRKLEWRISIILVTYILVALTVLMLNFTLARYLLMILPVLCILIACFTVYILENVNNKIISAIIILSLFIPLFYLKANYFQYDADLNYLDITKAQSTLTSYLNNVAGKNASIISEFPVTQGLTEIRAGYSNISYENISGCSNDQALSDAKYIILSSPGNMGTCRFNQGNYALLQVFKTDHYRFFLYNNISNLN